MYFNVFISKNKGFLVFIYPFLFFIIITRLNEFLDSSIGGVFYYLNTSLINSGLTCVLSGLGCIISDNYSVDNMKIVKEKIQINEFFFVKMELWGYGLLYLGVLNLIGGILDYF